ncbi:P-loop containing nucleoside triphosphate hydrolase protein [Xylariales sp. PMI_506]|nr:P-loop containing nucleoside triphosphate hydrolase protein [Xylariales sp. PMI_506]
MTTDETTSNPDEGHDVVKLYMHKCLDCGSRWSRYANIEEEETTLIDAVAGKPIVHRLEMRKGKWTTKSFTINDVAMRSVLSKALAEYQSGNCKELYDWTFRPPFKPLVHRWGFVKSICEESAAENSKSTSDLISFLEPELETSIKILKRTHEDGKVKYDRLWQIFPPGELVVAKIWGAVALGRVSQSAPPVAHCADDLVVNVEIIDWNGQNCGFTTFARTIRRYSGTRRIDSLPLYPISFSASEAELRSQALDRGRKFEALRGCYYRDYDGTEMAQSVNGTEARPATGRIVIDAFTFYHSRRLSKLSLRPLVDKDSDDDLASDIDAISITSSSSGSSYYEFDRAGRDVLPSRRAQPPGVAHIGGPGMPAGRPPNVRAPGIRPMAKKQPPPPPGRGGPPNRAPPPPGYRMPQVVHVQPPHVQPPPPNVSHQSEELAVMLPSTKPPSQDDITPLTDEQRLITNPWVRGFNLQTREWALFHVDNLKEPQWNKAAFDRLVIPTSQKELAWKFVKGNATPNHKFEDFVHDKGRGVIILMFGPPGVGKTYTAEAVAERARVPLFQLSAGMLGTHASGVERSLSNVLELCEAWNAMLLIDEADVFLGARSDQDLPRNELVATFLTKLEYYRGVCFLTTNRITDLDHAFQSRVDLFLPYSELDESARRQVWENFLEHTGRTNFAVSDADMDELVRAKLNGREIRNIMKSADLLSQGSEQITAETLKMLVRTRQDALDKLTPALYHGPK